MRWLLLFICGWVVLLLAGCAGHEHYFQPDARVGPARSGAPDSVLVTVGRHYAAHGRVYRWFLGDHYRALWAMPVTLPVLRLHDLPGQPKPTELGGGFQTTSITLETADGHRLVARTLDKDPYKTLPKIARKSFLLRLVRDETSAANPFAPLALPTLSRAAGIHYATPRFYYVAADDSTFDRLTPNLRGKVVLVEEKFNGAKTAAHAQLGGARDLVDSDQALGRRFRSPAHHFADYQFARARLFDLLIGDWDRHEGQWSWAEYPGKHTFYSPVPKDRDQAFFLFDDGLLPRLASRRWAVRKLRSFHPRFQDVPGLAFNARFLDARVLSAVTTDKFDSLARELQTRLPDSVLRAALAAWPKAIRNAEGERTFATLRARRDALPEAAAAFSHALARAPLIVGTDETDRFEITRLADGRVRVTRRAEADEIREDDSDYTRSLKGHLQSRYARTFSPAETRQLRIYGLGGADEFTVRDSSRARSRHPLRIDIYGGEGEDKLSFPHKSARGVRVYDTQRGIELPEKKIRGLKLKLADRGDVRVHAFDREGL